MRQSSLAQVREHTESTARQYALAEQATTLGWAPGSVQVIDADLGVSGRSTEGRDGFRYLISRVCLGEVGAVFGLEVSRLARSTADLTRLLELARLTDTPLIDGDGVYDLTDFNDRLRVSNNSSIHSSPGQTESTSGLLARHSPTKSGRGPLVHGRTVRPHSPESFAEADSPIAAGAEPATPPTHQPGDRTR